MIKVEAIVKAIRDPDSKVRDELRRKREAESRNLKISRFTAAFVLVGFAIGMAAAYFVGERLSVGGLWGGIVGAAIGQVVGTWHARRHAA